MRHFLTLIAVIAGLCSVRADSEYPFVKTTLESSIGYIMPQAYDIKNNPDRHGSDFWTPSESNVIEADRSFRRHLQDNLANPGEDFTVKPKAPEVIENVRSKYGAVNEKFDQYAKQFTGVVIGDRKLILCHYCEKPTSDPSSEYVRLGNDTNETVDFRYDPMTGKCSDVTFGHLKQ